MLRWWPKIKNWRPSWCPKLNLWELNSILMQILSFPIWPEVTWMKTLYRFTLTILPVPCHLDSSVGRALHWYRRGHGFDSGSKLNFCSGFLFATSAVIFTTATVCYLHNSFTYSPNMQYVQIFTLAVPNWLFWFVGSYLRAAVCKNQTYRGKSGKFDFFHIFSFKTLKSFLRISKYLLDYDLGKYCVVLCKRNNLISKAYNSLQ